MKNRVPEKKCIWLCFVFLIEFLMLIWEMAFVFHKSKQAKSRVYFKEIVNENKYTREISLCSNKQFRSAVVAVSSCNPGIESSSPTDGH